MSAPFAMQARFAARPGEGGAFEAILLEAAASLEDDDACLIYAVSRDGEDPDVVWVTEVWSDADAHAASLEDPAARALIARAMPLLAEPPEARLLVPAGGKGVRLP
jgi:quinol monooxygenase YgiN